MPIKSITSKVQSNVWLLCAILFAVCLTVFTLSYIVTEPQHVLPDIGGDGAKNNFTYLYHSLFGHGYWFDGMNYPYGEHIIYTDGQPLLSVFFARIGNVSVGTALTACWWLLGISYVLAIVYIYKALAHFKVSPLLAIFCSGLITVMSPQLLCLTGHYALGYPCIIPMVFYWSIMYHSTGRSKYCTWLFILGTLASFLHVYYAGMLLVWVGAYAVGYFIFTKNKPGPKLRHIAPLFAAAFGVAAIIGITLKTTDPVTDRPKAPLSLPESYTHIKQIFSSIYSPYWQSIGTQVKYIGKPAGIGEGFTYAGLVSIVLVVGFAAYAFRRRRAGKELSVRPSLSGFSPVWLFIALGVLIFSMGVPFIWHGQWLMKHFSFFRQFRALGRFSWIYYYIITIYSVVLLQAIFSHLIVKGRKTAAYAFISVSLLVWSIEASGYISFSRELARQSRYHYDFMFATHDQGWPSFLDEHKLKGSDYQAILALGFFHIGSEKLWVGDGAWTITLASRAALQLRLPIVDVMMSRSSWGQAEKQVRIAGGPYTDKPLLRDTKSNKPFLLMYFEEDSLNADQKYLISAADYIGHYYQCHIYTLYPEKLAALDKAHKDEITALLPYLHTGDTCIRGSGSWFACHYDEGHAAERLFGSGAAPAIKSDDSIIANIPVKCTGDSQLYEFSAWFLLHNKDHSSPVIEFEMLDSAGKYIGKADLNTKQSVDNYGMWFRANAYFQIKKACRSLRCKLDNAPNPAYIAMDELMLKPADALIISKAADGGIMVNNHLLNRTKQ